MGMQFYFKVTSKLGPYEDSQICINDFKLNVGVRGVFIIDFNPQNLYNEVTIMNFDTYADNLFAIDIQQYLNNLAAKNKNNYVIVMSHDECFRVMAEHQKSVLANYIGNQDFTPGSSFAFICSKNDGKLKVEALSFARGTALLEGNL